MDKKPPVNKLGKAVNVEMHMALVKLPEKQLLKFFQRESTQLVRAAVARRDPPLTTAH